MIVCKICGKEYKSIEMHLGTCLKKANITREAYTNLPEFGVKAVPVEDQIVELSDSDSDRITSHETVAVSPDPNYISGHDVRKNIFKGAFKERDPNRPLSVALSEFGISETEFLAILNQWKGKAKMPVGMRAAQRASIGDAEAEKLKDLERIETYTLETAESLVKNHGFTVTDVRSRKNNVPKTWVLKKKA
jgi:hypothetical protein